MTSPNGLIGTALSELIAKWNVAASSAACEAAEAQGHEAKSRAWDRLKKIMVCELVNSCMSRTEAGLE